MKDMKLEVGKFYLLDNDATYFCVDIQRRVKFVDKIVIKCMHTLKDEIYFGNLVNIENKFGPDYETTNEIEFSDKNVISEYNIKTMPLLYMDFPNVSK